MGEIIYNGRSSKGIGLEVETYPSYQSPQRSYETVEIPGRNGRMIIDNGSWGNATRSYEVSIGRFGQDYYEMIGDLSSWLHSTNTYARLEDSYEPDFFRMATYLESYEISNIFNKGGKGTLSFDCKPQIFLKIGEDKITVESGNIILDNPTIFPSKPIINVYGSGQCTITCRSSVMRISEVGSMVTIDCELQDAYSGSNNRNSTLTLSGNFPELPAGRTVIAFTGSSVTRVEVIPRWYTI